MKTLLKIILSFIVLTVILFYCVNLWLKTSQAKIVITDLISANLTGETGCNVSIKDLHLSLSWLSKIGAAEIILYDREGEFAVLQGVKINILLSTVLLRKLTVKNVNVANIRLIKKPVIIRETAKKESNRSGVPYLLGRIVKKINFNNLSVANLSVASAVSNLGHELILKIGGRLSFYLGESRVIFSCYPILTAHDKQSGNRNDKESENGNDSVIFSHLNIEGVTGSNSLLDKLLKDNNYQIDIDYNLVSNILDYQLNFHSPVLQTKAYGVLNINTLDLQGKIKYTTNILEKLAADENSTDINIIGEINLSDKINHLRVDNTGEMVLTLPEDSSYRFPKLVWHNSFLVKNNGEIRGIISLKQGDISANSNFCFTGTKLLLQNFKASGNDFPGRNFLYQAELQLDTKSQLVEGRIDIDSKHLSEIKQFLSVIYGGEAKLTALFTVGKGQVQNVSLKGNVNKLTTVIDNKVIDNRAIDNRISNNISISNIIIDLNILDLWHYKLSESKIALTDLKSGEAVFNKIELTASSAKQQDKISLNTKIKGFAYYPIDIQTAGELTIASSVKHPDITLKLLSITGKINKAGVAGDRGFLLTYLDNAINLNTGKISVGRGALEFNSTFTAGKVEAWLRIKDIPLYLTQGENISGETILPGNFKNSVVSGEINLSGPFTMPVCIADLSINNIKYKNGKSIKLNLNAEINKSAGNTGKLKSVIVQEHGSADILGELNLILPVNFTLVPVNFSIQPEKDFSADITILSPFDLLSLIPLPEDHQLSGIITGKIKLSGSSLKKASITGNINLSNGRYSQDKYGLHFNNINAQLIGKGGTIVADKITAYDNFNQQVKGKGELSIHGDNQFNLNINSKDFSIINSYFQGKINADLALTGNSSGAKIKGQIEVGNAEIQIPWQFVPKFPKLHIVDKVKTAEGGYDFTLNIGVRIAKRVSVQGWGVNSLLDGKLDIVGSARHPEFRGKLVAVKGKYQEFGTTLNVKEGTLIFDGSIPPSPFINIVGVAVEGSTEIRVILSGPILEPNVYIESTPPMSQESALSTLLFGENSDKISAFQALQLADSMRRLSGHATKFDPLSLGKKILKIDDINFKSDSNNTGNSSISLGKRLTDKIYFRVEQGNGGSFARTGVEIELTPKISVNSTTEVGGNTSLGVNWYFDY